MQDVDRIVSSGVEADSGGQTELCLNQHELAALSDAESEQVKALWRRLQHLPETVEEALEQDDNACLYDDVGSLVRYVRARQGDVARAEEMIRHTAAWRKEFNLSALRRGEYSSTIATENATGKIYVRGFDLRGRPLLYMKPRNEQSSDAIGIVQHLVYNMERAMACITCQEAQEKAVVNLADTQARKMVLLCDFADTGSSNLVPLSVAREIMRIMQDHYPEKLGNAFFINVPWLAMRFLSAVWPFVDPVTQEKIQFLTLEGEELSEWMSKYCDLAVLEPEFGGTAAEPFDSHTYLQAANNPGVGAEFGLEFQEQLVIGLPNVEIKGGMANKAQMWRMISDSRVMALAQKERGIARDLVFKLADDREWAAEEQSAAFNDAGVLLRFLRASHWKSMEALRRLKATVRWRKAFGIAALCAGAPADLLAQENARGRIFVRGSDRSGRPILVVRLRYPDLRRGEDYIRHAVYCIERAVACLDRREAMVDIGNVGPGSHADDQVFEVQEAAGKFTLLIDFTDYAPQNRPKLGTARAVLNILRDHYPERLGRAILLGPPPHVAAWWRLMSRSRNIPRELLQHSTIIPGPPERFANRLESIIDRGLLERCLVDSAKHAFDSAVFLSTPAADAGVFGSEFEAQLAVAKGSCGPSSWVNGVRGRLATDAAKNQSVWQLLDSLFGSGSGLALW